MSRTPINGEGSQFKSMAIVVFSEKLWNRFLKMKKVVKPGKMEKHHEVLARLMDDSDELKRLKARIKKGEVELTSEVPETSEGTQ